MVLHHGHLAGVSAILGGGSAVAEATRVAPLWVVVTGIVVAAAGVIVAAIREAREWRSGGWRRKDGRR